MAYVFKYDLPRWRTKFCKFADLFSQACQLSYLEKLAKEEWEKGKFLYGDKDKIFGQLQEIYCSKTRTLQLFKLCF
jgi:hypothetical protein